MELIDDAGNPANLYVHLDTYHMNIEESSSEHAVGVCGDKLGYASHSHPQPPHPPSAPHPVMTLLVNAYRERHQWHSKRHALLMILPMHSMHP